MRDVSGESRAGRSDLIPTNSDAKLTPPSIRTVSPLTNQLLTKKRARVPMSVLEPAVSGFDPSSGGG